MAGHRHFEYSTMAKISKGGARKGGRHIADETELFGEDGADMVRLRASFDILNTQV